MRIVAEAGEPAHVGLAWLIQIASRSDPIPADPFHHQALSPARYPIPLAPTTELDFDQLPPEKQVVYRQIQASHIHASPDGPWFFIIARSLAETGEFQLLGITDTAMLRPQVFALSRLFP